MNNFTATLSFFFQSRLYQCAIKDTALGDEWLTTWGGVGTRKVFFYPSTHPSPVPSFRSLAAQAILF